MATPVCPECRQAGVGRFAVGRRFRMKKIVIALLLILIITTPCYAVNIFDTILCKKVVLCANHMTVLVHRVTGQVKYVLLFTGQWKILTGIEKNQCQSMYEAQTQLKLKCN